MLSRLLHYVPKSGYLQQTAIRAMKSLICCSLSVCFGAFFDDDRAGFLSRTG